MTNASSLAKKSSITLSNSALNKLQQDILIPQYNRSALSPGIVHIGVGNFHRAHFAWYLHRLFQLGQNQDWAIIGAGVRPQDEEMRLKLQQQDYLTTLVELEPQGISAEIIGSMLGYVPVTADNSALIQETAKPEIRIVSLTLTEGGYFFDPATKAFAREHPDIQHDAHKPETPITAFGAIIAALKKRRESGAGPFTLLSFDNLQANGKILRQAVLSLATMIDPMLAAWIENNCSFPNSMVDCIVPATGSRELGLVQSFGLEDQAPVSHEAFRQWVVEDKFCAGRPEFEKVGVVFSDKLELYEAQKIRVLNAGHQIVANLAEILHLKTISEAMQQPKIRAVFRTIEIQEILPHLTPVPGITQEEYVDLVEYRFANPAIIDTTRRVAFDGSSRHPGFVLPSIRDGLATGTSISGLALVEAAWARMCQGQREDGSIIIANDPYWTDLQEQAKMAKETPSIWLEMRNIYGNLGENQEFLQKFSYWLEAIYDKGIEACLDEYLL